jgi:hypothetical protein
MHSNKHLRQWPHKKGVGLGIHARRPQDPHNFMAWNVKCLHVAVYGTVKYEEAK